MVNAYVADSRNGSSATEQDMICRREQFRGPAYRLFYKNPVNLVRGEGVWLYDEKAMLTSTLTTT